MLAVAPVRRLTIASEIRTASYVPSLRSMAAMRGLLPAEVSDSMVHMEANTSCSSLQDGQHATSESITPVNGSRLAQAATLGSLPGNALPLSRDDTLLSLDTAPARNAAELKSLLGNNSSRLKPGASVLPPPSPLPHTSMNVSNMTVTVALEQAKPRARVEVEIILDSDTCVQGNYMKGRVKLCVRPGSKTEPPVWLAKGRVRIIGYECINDEDRHTFYQCTAPLSIPTTSTEALYISAADEEGYAEAKEGVHVFPFSVWLPLDDSCGIARGVGQTPSGAKVLYIAMASFKVKCLATNGRSIAHFYRKCEIWPRVDPSLALATASRPLLAQTSKTVFLGGKGKISLTAQLHRLHWIAGQRCYLKFSVANDTRKTVKSLTLALVRTTTVFRPHPQLDALPRCADPDACQTSTTRKQVASSVLEMARGGEKGYASAKGWWTGVPPNQKLDFSHFILLPTDALSFTRVRLLEVEYTIRVSLSAGSLGADVHVILPIRIINFLSIDPPPGSLLASPEVTSGRYFMRKSDLHRNNTETSTVRGQHVLMDGGFAGAPYSDYDSETTPRFDGCPSEQSISVYDDSSSMDEELLNLSLHPRLDRDATSFTGLVGRSEDGEVPQLARDFGNPSTTTTQSSGSRPRGPRQLPAAPSCKSRANTGPTSFELRVQEKMHGIAESDAKRTHSTMEADRTNKPDNVPNVTWKTSSVSRGFSLPPSHKLPRPPLMTTRPIIQSYLTDPGPMPVTTPHIIDNSSSAAVVLGVRSNAVPDSRIAILNASRMRSQTHSVGRPSSPFSVVKSRIKEVEEKVFELHQRGDDVIHFC